MSRIRRSSAGAARKRPILLKYGQDFPNVGWFISNAAHASDRPFDGVFLYLTTSSQGVMSAVAQSEATVTTEMSTFHSASLGNLTDNFPIIRWTDNEPADGYWWDDADWAIRATNWAAFGAGVQGARVAGLAFDNEYYGSGTTPFDWANGSGIDSTHTLAQSQAKVRQRGEECMSALIAEWPDVRVIMLHGPYISDPRTGVDVWTDTATDPPFWNPVDHANELSAWFTFGMVDATIGTAARVYDGGETYGVRSLQAIRNVRDWQLRGMPSGTTIVPAELQDGAYKIGAAQGVYDQDEFNSFAVQAASAIQDQIEWALLTSDIAWFYTEYFDWWEGGFPGAFNIDHGFWDDYWNAVAVGRARGRRQPDPTLRAVGGFGTSAVGGSTTDLAANVKTGSKFTSSQSVDVTTVRAYLDGGGAGTGSQVARAMIYAGDGTAVAGALTGYSAEVTVTDGQAAEWVDFTFSPAVTCAAGTWWLCVHTGGNTNTVRLYRDATASALGALGDTYANGAGAGGFTFGLSAGIASIYATGTAP